MASSFAALGARLALMATAIHESREPTLKAAAELVETSAKSALGTYLFGWEPLAPSTIERKETGDSPLLETGAMRDSIEHVVTENEAIVGTNDPKAAYLELGTSKMPPRPFLSGAVMHEHDRLKELFEGKFKSALERR